MNAVDALGIFRLENGALWAEVADAHQLDDAQAVLGDSRRRHWLGRSRGWSKTSDVALVALAYSLATPDAITVIASADREQSGLLIEAARGFIRRSPEVRDLFDVKAEQIRSKVTQAVIQVVSADAASSYGLSPNLVVADEFCQWIDHRNAQDLWTSLSTAAVKRSGRVVVISTAGQPGSWQHAVYRHALDDPAWRVSETQGPAPWLDPEEIESERRRLTDSAFRRWWLNQWVAPDDAFLDAADIELCARHHGPLSWEPGRLYAGGVDIGIHRDNTVVAIVSADRKDRSHARVDRLLAWTPDPRRGRLVDLEDVELAIENLSQEYRCKFRLDPTQAESSIARLARKGVKTERYTFSQANVSKLVLTLSRAVKDHAIDLDADDAAFLDELRRIRIQETGPATAKFVHSRTGHDDRLVAVALGLVHVIDTDARPRSSGFILPDGRVFGDAGFAPRPRTGPRPSRAYNPDTLPDPVAAARAGTTDLIQVRTGAKASRGQVEALLAGRIPCDEHGRPIQYAPGSPQKVRYL